MNDSSWTSYHLLIGNDPLVGMSDTTQYSGHRSIMNLAGVKDKKKVTHRGRVRGAQFAQACGATVEEIAQHGNWALNRLATHYLSSVNPGVALQMAGFDQPLERLWLPRNTVIPPIELQRQLFPFIEGQYPEDDDWEAWIENIMLDRDIYYGRSINAHESSQVNDSNSLEYVENDDDDVPRRRHLILLAHLRKVILQDAVAIMDLDDPTCKYDDHFIFALPIFKSTLFRQFRDQLRQQMDSATSPLVDSLSANAPAIHQEFQDLKVRASDLSYQLGRILTSVDEVVKGIEHVGKVSDRTDRRNESIDKTVRNLDTNMTKLTSDIGKKNKSISSMYRAAQRWMSQGTAIFEEELANQPENEQTTTATPPPPFSAVDPLMPLQNALLELSSSPLPSAAHDPLDNNPDQSDHIDYSDRVNHPHSDSDTDTDAEGPEGIERRMTTLARLAAEERRRKGKERKQPLDMPEYIMLARDRPLEDIWQEWFYGVDGVWSIMELDMWYGTKWRRAEDTKATNANAVLYLFKKHIVSSVLRAFPSEKGLSLRDKEASALSIQKMHIQNRFHQSVKEKSFPTRLHQFIHKRKA